MALSENMTKWVADRVEEAKEILANPNSTHTQRTLAHHVLVTWPEYAKSASTLADELMCAWTLIDAHATVLEEDGALAAEAWRYHATRMRTQLIVHAGYEAKDFE